MFLGTISSQWDCLHPPRSWLSDSGSLPGVSKTYSRLYVNIYIYKDIDDDSFPPSVASLWLPKVFQKTRGSFVRKKSMCIFNHMCVWLCITGIGPCCAVFFFTGVFAMKLRRSETLQNTCNKHSTYWVPATKSGHISMRKMESNANRKCTGWMFMRLLRTAQAYLPKHEGLLLDCNAVVVVNNSPSFVEASVGG